MGSTAILTMYIAPFTPQPSVTSGGNETVNLISTSWDGVENTVKGYI